MGFPCFCCFKALRCSMVVSALDPLFFGDGT